MAPTVALGPVAGVAPTEVAALPVKRHEGDLEKWHVWGLVLWQTSHQALPFVERSGVLRDGFEFTLGAVSLCSPSLVHPCAKTVEA